jgi:hypothetical protein
MASGKKRSEKLIGECTYVVDTLPGTLGIQTFEKVGPLCMLAVSGGAPAVVQAIGNFDASKFIEACKAFATHTMLRKSDGKEPQLSNVFDDHFSGNYLEMVEWFAFCVECNYSNFFDGLIGKLASLSKPSLKDSILKT